MTQIEDEDAKLRRVDLRDVSSNMAARQQMERGLIAAQQALRESNERITNILDSIRDAFFVLDSDWRISYLNKQAESVLRPLNKSRESLLGKVFWDEFPDLVGTTVEQEYRRAVKHQVVVEFETVYRPLNAWFSVRACPSTGSSHNGLSIYLQDITKRKQADAFLTAERKVLGMIATGKPLNEILHCLALETESLSVDGMLCSILLIDEAGQRLQSGAAPSLPDAYNQAIHGVRIGPVAGSCGTAAFERRTVIVSDIANDPLWTDFKTLATEHGLAACSSTPILSSQSKLLGTIAMYYRKPQAPSAHDEQLIELSRHLASIAIERSQQEATYRQAARERKQLLEAERAARTDAERISMLKDEFLATLSHELRTPLNAILGWSQILATGRIEGNELAEGLETIQRNARAQAQLIEDLLDMSRIISGKVRLDVQRVNLSDVVEAAVTAVRPSVEAKGIRLRKVVDPHAGPVSGDPNRLQQVVWNLLTNAVKFTPKGGTVDVVVQRVDSHLEVTVTDSGVGIPPEFLPLVFERFRQADSSTTRRHGGLGLGLSIVKQLVELHGGSISAKSAGKDQGSTFTMNLPLAPFREGSTRGHPSTSNGPAVLDDGIHLGGVKVLVIDDEQDARTLIERVLADCEAVVTTAANADDGLNLLCRERPHVLISDIGMPDKDGYQFIREVRGRSVEEGGATPAIALTAFARSEDRTRAMIAGYQVHISKPIEPQELIVTVASLAGRTGKSSARKA